MVHALKQIQGWLKGDGHLIDIHPTGEPPPLHVQLGEERHLVGWVQEESDYVKYSQADEALNEAVQRGWFQVEQRQRVTFATYAPDLVSLRDHLREVWHDAQIEDLVAMQIESLLSNPTEDKELIVEEKIWMARLRPLL